MKSPLRLPVITLWCLLGILGVAATGSAPAVARTLPQDHSAPDSVIIVPGPLRSLLRMAGVSQKAEPDDVLPLIADNVFSRGYENWQLRGRPTEFLILTQRYVRQARELSALAGPDDVIHVDNCQQGKQLLSALGYRLRKNCGDPGASVVTEDAVRAFVTTDSGFPLLELEEALQKNQPFSLPYPKVKLPVIFTESDWVSVSSLRDADSRDLLDVLLADPGVARLYWAISKLDRETRNTLLRSPGLKRLVPLAPVLDFYGQQLAIRNGRVLVPGGSNGEAGWAEIVGAKPDSPGEFVTRLFSKDRGWLAAYFDALSRVPGSQQAHFTDPRQLRRYYAAFRSTDPKADAARPAFRPAPGLLLLLTRLQWQPSGQPLVPGNLETWNEILRKNDSGGAREWRKHGGKVTDPYQLLEAMFAESRRSGDFGPLQMYLTLSELDSRRPLDHRLRAETVQLMASRFSDLSHQYRIFLEFPQLDDASITRFLSATSAIDKISDHTLRGNTMGAFQANVGLWQIMARQGEIAGPKLNESWMATTEPFLSIASEGQLFDAGCNSLRALARAAKGQDALSQEELIALLAGPPQATPDGKQMHAELTRRIESVMQGQRLVSLDTLRALGAGLNDMAKGAPGNDGLVVLARELREFEMPRPMFSGSERSQWAAGVYNNRHTEMQMRTDLVRVIQSHPSQKELREARGQLAPFLRDTLVGLNYAYYEPPGSQVLRNNPLFVRSHDFAGETLIGDEKLWQAPQLIGEGTPAGGGAHFVGSLADLPYALAEVEQDFIAPENVQALIWRELVPGLLVSSTLPRWWGVTREELHTVTLYQKSGEELISASTSNPATCDRVVKILSERASPRIMAMVEHTLRSGNVGDSLARLTPADTFYLAIEYRSRFPEDSTDWGPSSHELLQLTQKESADADWEKLSRHFGVPHPVLMHSYAPELVNVKPFPTFEGYSSRLLAETWDSNNLYWARLVDEKGYSPVQLNQLAPELTRRMVEKIFATDLEDWPAILRAMRETGDEFRQGKEAFLRDQTGSESLGNGTEAQETRPPAERLP